jgi:Domain of unknown function (DUF4440)
MRLQPNCVILCKTSPIGRTMSLTRAIPTLTLAMLLSACVNTDRKAEMPESQSVDQAEAVRAVLDRREQAMQEADMTTLNELWSSDAGVFIFEQGGADSSWAGYRDHHLGPELAAFDSLVYRQEGVEIHAGSHVAVATGRYFLSAKYQDRNIESNGVFTPQAQKATSSLTGSFL